MATTSAPVSATTALFQNMSLEGLGSQITNATDENRIVEICDLVTDALIERVDISNYIDHFLEVHMDSFKSVPSNRHYNELIALMVTKQTLRNRD